ncbi:MAG: hypothetical protein ACYTE3_15130, partial [Planctomycetota bacterium]
MKRFMLRFHLLAAFLVFALLACPSWGETIEVGDLMRKLVEADWIEQDARQGGDFSLEYTNQLITRGHELAERLRSLSAPQS